MVEVLRPWLDGNIPAQRGPGVLLASGRADVEVAFVERVGEGSCRVYYPADTLNEVVAPLTEGAYSVGAICPAVLGSDGRVAMVYPPLTLGEETLLVGDWTQEISSFGPALENLDVDLAQARTELDEQMGVLGERLTTTKADADAAASAAAAALIAASNAQSTADDAKTDAATAQTAAEQAAEDADSKATAAQVAAQEYALAAAEAARLQAEANASEDAAVLADAAEAAAKAAAALDAKAKADAAQAAAEAKAATAQYAAEAAQTKANKAESDAAAANNVAVNLRATVEGGLMRVGKASNPPTPGKGLQWLVLDEATGSAGVGLRVANGAGSAWVPYLLIVEELMVLGESGTILLRDNTVRAGNIVADDAFFAKVATEEFWATLATIENLRVTSRMIGENIEGKVVIGGLVQGAQVETDRIVLRPNNSDTAQTVYYSQDFSSGLDSWVAQFDNTVARVTTPARSAGGALRTISTGNSAPAGVRRTFPSLQVPAFTVVEAWVRATSSPVVACMVVDGGSRVTGPAVNVATNEWTHVSVTLPADAVITNVSVGISSGAGLSGVITAYVDDARIYNHAPPVGAAVFDLDGQTPRVTVGGASAPLADVIAAANLDAPYSGKYPGSAVAGNGVKRVTITEVPEVDFFDYTPIVSLMGLDGSVDRLTVTVIDWSGGDTMKVKVKNQTTVAVAEASYSVCWALIPTNTGL